MFTGLNCKRAGSEDHIHTVLQRVIGNLAACILLFQASTCPCSSTVAQGGNLKDWHLAGDLMSVLPGILHTVPLCSDSGTTRGWCRMKVMRKKEVPRWQGGVRISAGANMGQGWVQRKGCGHQKMLLLEAGLCHTSGWQ